MRNKFTSITKKIIQVLSVPEYFFVIIASLFGILFILIIPPFQTPDENVHFYRAYEVSQLYMNRTTQEGGLGSMLPMSIAQTENEVNASPLPPTHIQFNPYNKYSLKYTKSALFDIPLNESRKTFYHTETYPMLVYAPQAIMVAIGRLFSLPIIVMLYMTRTINLIIWVVVVYMCIKNFPWKKWALVGACLLPVVVSQTISPGLDVLAISSTLVFLTLVFKSIADRNYKLTGRKILLLVVAGIFMTFTKSTLAVFLPLVFLIKGNQIVFKYKNVARFTVLFLPIVMYIAWTIITSGASGHIQDSSVSQQMSILLHNPLHFFRLLFNTTFFISNAGNAIAQSFVGDFGWLDTPLSPPFVYLGVIFMAFLFFVGTTRDRIVISRNTRLVMSLIAFGLITSTFLAMYIYSTLPIDNNIKGVQGRYFIPAIFLLIPILSNNQIITSKLVYVRTIQIASAALLTVSVLTIVARYYHVYIPT